MGSTAPVWPYRLAMSVILAGSLSLGAIWGYVLWPVRVVYVDTPLRVLTPIVRAGDAVTVHLRYSKPYTHEALVGWMFASRGNVALGPVGLSALPPGEHEVNVYVPVPLGLPPGEYVVIFIVERQVRLPVPALWDRPVTASSEPFQVIR